MLYSQPKIQANLLKNAFPPLLYAKYNNIFYIFYLLEFRTVSVKMQRRLEASKGVGEEVSDHFRKKSVRSLEHQKA